MHVYSMFLINVCTDHAPLESRQKTEITNENEKKYKQQAKFTTRASYFILHPHYIGCFFGMHSFSVVLTVHGSPNRNRVV